MMRRLDRRSAASTTSRVLGARRVARAQGHAGGGLPHRATTRSSRCSTAARTRAGRCRRASSSADSVACPLHNWTIGLADGCAQRARRRLHAALQRCKVDGGAGAARRRKSCATRASAPSNRRTGVSRDHAPPARYCGVGCGVIIESDGAQITGVRGDPDHPANFGRLCTKGSTLHLTAAPHITRQVRALQPHAARQRAAPRCSRSAGTRRWTWRPTASPRIVQQRRPRRGRPLPLAASC